MEVSNIFQEEASGDLNEDANEDKVEEPKVESVEVRNWLLPREMGRAVV